MAINLHPLRPPVVRVVGDLTLRVDAAAANAEGGVTASIAASGDGRPLHADQVDLQLARQRGSFVNHVLAAYPAADRGALVLALLEWNNSLAAVLAQRRHQETDERS